MALLESASNLLIWAFLLLAGLPVLYLLILTLASLRPEREPADGGAPRRFAVLVPAHNESLLISDAVTDLLQQRYPPAAFAVVVIADNCADDTAEIARARGARVIERKGDPGKGQALHEALRLLLKEDWDAFLMMDADSHLHPDTLAALNGAIAAGAGAMQIHYGVLNPNDSMRTRAMELSTASFNALRLRGKTALGLSCGIYGNGFCLTREAVQAVPYLAHSIVEDIEYHILLLKAGRKVIFVDRGVWVKAQFPVGPRTSEVQRIRWERGRILMIRHYAPSMLRELARGNLTSLSGLLDVLMPPVSLIALALLPAALFGTPLQVRLAAAMTVGLYLHYVVAAARYGSILGLLRLTLYIPWYFLWKTAVVVRSLLLERHLPWIRTDRHPHSRPTRR